MHPSTFTVPCESVSSVLTPSQGSELDDLGRASMVSQCLNKPLTSVEILDSERSSSEGRMLHVAALDNDIVGYATTGYKDLWLYDHKNLSKGLVHCPKALCLLDFYVDRDRQRRGLGRIVFDHMLEERATQPGKLAFDRPSEKLLPFLAKHYGLAETPGEQSAKFAVFSEFFG